MTETIESYADLALSLRSPHGINCPCLVCSDQRAAIGCRSLISDPGAAAVGTTCREWSAGSQAGSDATPTPLAASCVQTPTAGAPARPPRTLRSYVQQLRSWSADANRLSRGLRDGSRPQLSAGTEAERMRHAAATATLWGLPVGILRDPGVDESEVPS